MIFRAFCRKTRFFLALSAVKTDIQWLMKGEYILQGVFCNRPHKLLGVLVLQKLDTFPRQSCTCVELNRNSYKFCVFWHLSAGKIEKW